MLWNRYFTEHRGKQSLGLPRQELRVAIQLVSVSVKGAGRMDIEIEAPTPVQAKKMAEMQYGKAAVKGARTKEKWHK